MLDHLQPIPNAEYLRFTDGNKASLLADLLAISRMLCSAAVSGVVLPTMPDLA